MAKVDFDSIVGGTKKKTPENKQKEPENSGQKDNKSDSKESTEMKGSAQNKNNAIAEKLENEFMGFHRLPKGEREKRSEEFDFKQITEQIKEKLGNATGEKGFDEKVVEKEIESNSRSKASNGQWKIERVTTGIIGLDELISGGFEKGSTVLLVGSAGVGKSLFGLQFLYNGAKNYNEPGIYISFEEGRDSLYRHSSNFGWDFEELERKNLFRILEYKPHQVEKLMADGGGTMRSAIKEVGAKRLVIDSITSYSLLFKDEYQKRENILELFEYLKKWNCTSLIISELPPKVAEVKEGSVGFLTDAIIALYYSKHRESEERAHSLEILKMRGTKHTSKVLALQFENKGLVVYSDVEIF